MRIASEAAANGAAVRSSLTEPVAEARPGVAREHFIPFRRTDVVGMCAADGAREADEARAFADFAELLTALYHFEHHALLERLKDAYAPFNPDRDTRRIHQPAQAEQDRLAARLVADLTRVLEKANYSPIGRQDLERALTETSLFNVRLHVDFDDFEQLLLFARGASRRRETIRSAWGLVRREIEFTHYDRVVLYVRFKDAAYFEGRGRLSFEPGSVVVKLFQNVPEGDLEMLLPGTEVRMRPLDKLLIGIPAAASGLVVATTKLGATLLLLAALVGFWLGWRREPVVLDQAALLALASGLGALGGYVWKQLASFNGRKMRFMKALTDNLYFKNLDNNVGVFHQLIDAAEEEECKEAIIAAHVLDRRGALTTAELDRAAEAWLRDGWGAEVDFEVEDAVSKLERLGLVHAGSDGRWRLLPLPAARRRLDALWDAAFSFEEA